MKIYLFISVACSLFISGLALAQMPPIKESSVKLPAYLCERDGGAVAINFKEKKIWMMETLKETSGLEFPVISMQNHTCKHEISWAASLQDPLDPKAILLGELKPQDCSGSNNNIQLTVAGDDGTDSDLIFNCHFSK